METQERELIHINSAVVEQITQGIDNTLPAMKKIVTAYNQFLPHVPELTTGAFRQMFIDIDSFIEGLKWEWYERNFAQLHKTNGLTKIKGMAQVDDQIPDFQPLINAVKDCWAGNSHNPYMNGYNLYANPSADAYEIVDHELIINEAYLATAKENHSFYLSFPNEFKVKQILENITKNFDELLDLVPSVALQLDDHLIEPDGARYSKIIPTIFDVIYPRFGETKHPVLKPSLNFYHKLKKALIETGTQG